MAHEHIGNCCGPQHEHEAHGHAAGALGRMCCAGQCHHPEHMQMMQGLLDKQHFSLEDGEEYDESSVKRKKKKLKNGLLQALQVVGM